MAEPKLVPGTLYIDRDRDFRTGEWGPYVKIGIVRNQKEASARNKEHQTGNPRKIHILHELAAPMVENLETRLHHWFAEHWVHGEWFLMDDEFVEEHVLPAALSIIEGQNQSVVSFETKTSLANVASDGIVRIATKEEAALAEEYALVKTRFERSAAAKELLRSDLLDAMGEVNGVEGVIQLQHKVTAGTFDKTAFKKAHPEIFNRFVSDVVSEPKGTLSPKSGLPLSKVDEALNAANSAAKKRASSLALSLLDEPSGIHTEAVKGAHLAYVQSLREASEAEFDMHRLKARMAVAVGTGEGIENVVTWKREAKTSQKFDAEAFKMAHPELHDSFMKSSKESIVPKVSMCRPYPL